ncbi:hypothetical protein KW785_02910 [Candidatus Parcubacteria bacterium]|nr:hypothetical protein [Candidatus Parcubacteria bacterium]
MIKRVITFFDKFEDKTRGHLSKYPIVYTIIGAVAIVLFWRGVWHTADILQARGGFIGFLFYEPVSLILVIIILLATGLFVSYFIGDSILISGLKSEKKLHEKTAKEVLEEEVTLLDIESELGDLKKEMDEIRDTVGHPPKS